MPPMPHTPDLTDSHRRIERLEGLLGEVLLRLAALEREARTTGDVAKG